MNRKGRDGPPRFSFPLLLSLLVFISLFPAPPASASPEILIDTSNPFLGRLLEGQSAQRRLEFTNAGDEYLLVDTESLPVGFRVKSISRSVAPGETGGVLIEFQAKDCHIGAVANEIVLSTNDPSRPRVTWVLNTDVVPAFLFDPAQTVLQVGYKSRTTIRSNPDYGDTPPKILLLRPLETVPGLTAWLEQVGDTAWRLDLSLTEEETPPPARFSIDLVTDNRYMPVYKMRCRVNRR